jgi:hypothetical protein
MQMFGRTPVAEFGPIKLKSIRDQLVNDGLARRTINNYVHRP